MESSGKPSQAERLQALRLQVLSLADQLQALTSQIQPDRLPWLQELISQVQELVDFVDADHEPALADKKNPPPTPRQLKEFGKLLRDKRNAAGFSRVQLARRAKLSDATIKFIETARHPPSRATLIRLLAVAELKLDWRDVPGSQTPPPVARDLVASEQPQSCALNCLLTPTFDPMHKVAELGRLLRGAGGHLEQSGVYLDHQSAAAYLALCQQSAGLASLRASTPLAEAARRIAAATGPVALQVIALGAGAAQLEVRLVQHLLEAERVPRIELCLLDISQPLLAYGQKYAADVFTGRSGFHVWGMQCDVHELSLYSHLIRGGAGTQPENQRLFCMLGETLAHLDNEPRFLRHMLPPGSRGDLLLFDMQLAQADATNPEQIKKRDKQWATGVTAAEVAWLSGPIWRHGKDVVRVDFHWDLDTHLPLPGSYALDAVATVHGPLDVERRFSMFQYRRYAPDQVAACLLGLGWEELGNWPFGSAEQPASLRLFRKCTEPLAHE